MTHVAVLDSSITLRPQLPALSSTLKSASIEGFLRTGQSQVLKRTGYVSERLRVGCVVFSHVPAPS